MKKKRFHYYEDEDVYNHIKNLKHWQGGKWVRDATRKKMETELSTTPSRRKK